MFSSNACRSKARLRCGMLSKKGGLLRERSLLESIISCKGINTGFCKSLNQIKTREGYEKGVTSSCRGVDEGIQASERCEVLG